MRENSRFGRQTNYSPPFSRISASKRKMWVCLLLCPAATSVSYFLPARYKESARCTRVAWLFFLLARAAPVSRFVLDLLSLLRRAYRLSLEVGQKNLGLEHRERGRKYTPLHFCIWGTVAQFVLPNYDLCTLCNFVDSNISKCINFFSISRSSSVKYPAKAGRCRTGGSAERLRGAWHVQILILCTIRNPFHSSLPTSQSTVCEVILTTSWVCHTGSGGCSQVTIQGIHQNQQRSESCHISSIACAHHT